MKTFHFFALDLGATSGRSFHVMLESDKIILEELTRFPNRMIKIHNKYYWDIYYLYVELLEALKVAVHKNITLDSIGVDTWGVDFVCLAKDGTLIDLPRSYRDSYTQNIEEEYFNLIPKDQLYKLTGIQILNINTLFQLYASKKENRAALESAETILFVPDALNYLLTGNKTCEYTIASTSQLLNPQTKNFEKKLLESLDLKFSLFPPISLPGQIIGYLSEEIKKECKIGDTPVVAVAGHDTASAIVSVPAENGNYAYISSGTWSLMGIEIKEPIITEESYRLNFTNEGGVEGTIRFLKNITGMWILERCREEWKINEGICYSYEEILTLSDSALEFRSVIDVDHPIFINPESMSKAIQQYCKQTQQALPISHAEIIRCFFESLALKYKYVLEELKKLTPLSIERIHVIGGGAKNKLLNQYTANATGKTVIAGPSEATVIGNVLLQAKALGVLNNLEQMRKVVKQSTQLEVYEPQNLHAWQKAYENFAYILNSDIEVVI